MNRPGTPLPRASEMALAPMPHGLVQPDTARGGITPKLDTEAALAPGRGLASLGTALERTGGALGELRLKQLQAIGIRHEADADMMMSDAEDAIAAETAGQPDETKWGGIAATHIAKLRERIAAMPLSRATAEAVTAKMNRWELHRTQQTEIASARHSISRARGAIVGKADAAIARGDEEALRRTLQGGVSGGYLSPERVDEKMREFATARDQREWDTAAAARKDRLNSYLEAVKQYGREATEKLLEDPKFGGGKLDEKEREGLREMGQRFETVLMSEDAGRFEKALHDGQFSPGEVDGWERDNKRLTPDVRQRMQDVANRYNREGVRQIVALRSDYYSSVFSTEARDYKRSDGPEKWWEIRGKVMLLPKERGERIMKMLDDKDPFLHLEEPLSAPAETYIESELDGMLTRGEFGSFDNGTGKDRSGQPLPSSKLGWSSEEVYERDGDAFARALDQKAKLYEKWAGEMKKIPGAGALKGREVLLGLLPDAKKARLLDDFDRRKQAGKKAVESMQSLMGKLPWPFASPPPAPAAAPASQPAASHE